MSDYPRLLSVRIRFGESRFAICCDQVDPNLNFAQLFEQVKPYSPDLLRQGRVQFTRLNDCQIPMDTTLASLVHGGYGRVFDIDLILRPSGEDEQKLLESLPELVEEEDRIKKKRLALEEKLREVGETYKKAKV